MKQLLTVLSCVAPVEAELVDRSYGGLAGAVKETSLVVLMTVPLLHVTLLDLKAFPQHRILDSLNLEASL